MMMMMNMNMSISMMMMNKSMMMITIISRLKDVDSMLPRTISNHPKMTTSKHVL